MLAKLSNHMNREEMKRMMEKGYPATSKPILPAGLDLAVERKTFNYNNKYPMLELTLAAEGSDLVEKKSLEMIHKKLAFYFGQYPELLKGVEQLLLSNTLAISFAKMNFQIGEKPHEFKLFDSFKPSPGSFFSYQKLSDAVHCTYFNENNIVYLAGITFYPAFHGTNKLSKDQSFLIHMAQVTTEHYPLSDRKRLLLYQKYNYYGRDCTKAGKRVAVDFKKINKVKHMEYSHLKNKYVYTPCDECQKDFDNYKWVEPKKEKSVPVPDTPSSDTSLVPKKDTAEIQKPDQESQDTEKENAAACNCGKTHLTEELKAEKEEEPVEESDKQSKEQCDSDDNDEFENVSPSVECRLQDLELNDEDTASEFEMLIS